MKTATSDQGEAAEVAAALDMLLTQAALGPTRRFFPGKSSLRFAGALARRSGLDAEPCAAQGRAGLPRRR
jgi:hypothetical protein